MASLTDELPPVEIRVTSEDEVVRITPHDLKWNQDEDLGDDACSARIDKETLKQYRPALMWPSMVEITSRDLDIWAGFLNGVAPERGYNFEALGYGKLLDNIFDPIFLQIADLGIWRDAEPEPWLAQTNQDLRVFLTEDAFMRWVTTGQSHTGRAGMVADVRDQAISTLRFTDSGPYGASFVWQVWQYSTKAPGFQYWLQYNDPVKGLGMDRVNQNTGPASNAEWTISFPWTRVRAGDPAASAPGVVAGETLYDGIALTLAGSTASPGGVANIQFPRINGTLIKADSMTPTEFLTLLANLHGWKADPVASGINILPFSVESGEARSSAGDYLARILGGVWGLHTIRGRQPLFQLRRWPREGAKPKEPGVYTVSTGAHNDIRLKPSQERINAVIVSWTDTTDDSRTTIVRRPTDKWDSIGCDQQRKQDIPGRLPPDSTLPEEIAWAVLDTYARVNYVGTIEGAWVTDWDGTILPMWAVQPGEAIFVPENRDDESKGLYYVHANDGSPRGARLQVGPHAASLERAMAHIEREQVRNPERFR